jgi:putative NADPH-quinone reductase
MGRIGTDGVTDQTVSIMASALEGAGAAVEKIMLRDWPIEFCHNCRACTQVTGEKPGKCAQQDNMEALVEKIETCDGLILASPTNFGSATAIFKRFLERLVCYAYWPWDMAAPKYRKKGVAPKKAVLVSSCAAPMILGRFSYNTRKDLRAAAKAVGAKPVATLLLGLVAGKPDYRLSNRQKNAAQKAALKLMR